MKAPAPQVRRFAQGAFQTNSFLVSQQGECFVVDAPEGLPEVIQTIQSEGLKPQFLFLTHAHSDHIEGLPRWWETFPGVPVWIHSAEASFPADPQLNLSAYLDEALKVEGPLKAFEASQSFTFQGGTWQVLHTPGHSPGSACLYSEEFQILFAGDLLFRGSVGRSDFPTSNPLHLTQSLNRILELEGTTQVHCGHGGSTTLAREKATNPYLRE